MKQFLIFLMAVSVGCCVHAAASVKTGNDALRQLVVVPMINVQFGYFAHPEVARILSRMIFVPAEIEKLQKEVKANPEDLEKRLRLGEALRPQTAKRMKRGFSWRARKKARGKKWKCGRRMGSLSSAWRMRWGLSDGIPRWRVCFEELRWFLPTSGNAGADWEDFWASRRTARHIAEDDQGRSFVGDDYFRVGKLSARAGGAGQIGVDAQGISRVF